MRERDLLLFGQILRLKRTCANLTEDVYGVIVELLTLALTGVANVKTRSVHAGGLEVFLCHPQQLSNRIQTLLNATIARRNLAKRSNILFHLSSFDYRSFVRSIANFAHSSTAAVMTANLAASSSQRRRIAFTSLANSGSFMRG